MCLTSYLNILARPRPSCPKLPEKKEKKQTKGIRWNDSTFKQQNEFLNRLFRRLINHFNSERNVQRNIFIFPLTERAKTLAA